MNFLVQNKKLIISSLSIFITSLTVLVFFLGTNSENLDLSHGHGDVMHVENHVSNENSPETEYLDYLDERDTNWFAIDLNGNIENYSSDFDFMFNGREKSDIHGEIIYNYINAKDLPKIVSLNTMLIKNGENYDGIGPYRLKTKDERELLVILKAIPLKSEKNDVEKILFVINDITKFVEEMSGSLKLENETSKGDEEFDIRLFHDFMASRV